MKSGKITELHGDMSMWNDLEGQEVRKRIKEFLGPLRKYYNVSIEYKKPHSTFEFSSIEFEAESAARYDGFHVLISSNLKHDINEMIELYDSKDGIEKAFYTIKHPIEILFVTGLLNA